MRRDRGGGHHIPVEGMQARLPLGHDLGLLAEFPHHRVAHGLAALHTAAGQVPAADIGVAHEGHTSRPVQGDAAHAEGHAPGRESPEVEQAPQERPVEEHAGARLRRRRG